jgi:hypothetical protein
VHQLKKLKKKQALLWLNLLLPRLQETLFQAQLTLIQLAS